MAGVDSIMETCPLKHEIRVKFWIPFVRKLRKPKISYLTLYSPPLMDVKYLHHCNLIELDNGKYSDVVGVTIDKDAFADANSTLNYRLDLLLNGDINHLLDGKNKSIPAKELINKFPFDVINLDYTDALHKYSLNDVALSPHFNSIETILKQQKGHGQFILFITAFFDMNAYNKNFLEGLREIIDSNIKDTPGFLDKLQAVFACNDSEEFQNTDSKNFFSLGVLKFILLLLKDNGYDLKTAGIKWLIRDRNHPTRHMLHMAFHISDYVPPKVSGRGSVGKRTNNVEYKSVDYLRNDFPEITESSHYDALLAKHENEINTLHKTTFELDVPEPKANE